MKHRELKNPCFVYVHRRTDNNQVFYVGKASSRKRCYSRHGRNKHWERVANKYGFVVDIVLSGLTNEQACKNEIDLIAFYGIENLTNKTTGGEGAPGNVISEKQRKYMSELFKGRPVSEKTRKAQIAACSKPVGTMCGLRFSSAREAVKYLRSLGFENACAANIFSSLKGKSQKAYGFEWRYLLQNGMLSESKYKKPARQKVENDAGFIFECKQDAAKWCISEGHAKASSITTCSTNIWSAITGRRGVVYAYGFRWKNADDPEFREKESRKGMSIKCSNGMDFRSLNAAAKFIGGENNKNQHINLQIKKCCEGLITEAYGYNWRYLDDSTS